MAFGYDQTGMDSWTCYQPDGRVDTSKILSGIGEVPTHSCQYWVNGLAKVCSNWNHSEKKCVFKFGGDTDIPAPTGYNNGDCDGLGRKSWCDKYSYAESEDGLSYDEGYVCIAPCIERSGLGTQASGIIDTPYLNRVTIDEVTGYNAESDSSIGRCDGHGMGRGATKFGMSVEELKKQPPLCNYYRPYSMGFGSLQPQEAVRDIKGNLFVDQMVPYAVAGRSKRLPYHFKVFNLRARAQKCAYWDQDFGTDFTINEVGQIILTGEPFTGSRVTYCICPDTASNPYSTRNLDSTKVRPLLRRVWSEDVNAVICNGAKPECPCYTGEWLYNIDDKMLPGMRIEAEQILELRFWVHIWADQETYEKYFESIPGTHKDDPTTADIYTFSYWKKLSFEDPGESIMAGKKVKLCMPANPASRFFDKDLYVKIEPVTFPTAYFKRGTATINQVSYPTLLRDLAEMEPIPLDIVYPYFTKNPFDLHYGCNFVPADLPPCVKRFCTITEDRVSVVGSTVRNKTIYTVNLSSTTEVFKGFNEYDSSFLVKEEHRTIFFNEIKDFITRVKTADYKGDIIYEDTSDSNGVFAAGPVRLNTGRLNKIVVIVMVSDFEIEFKKINVWSQWHGGIVNQLEFEKAYEEGDGGYIEGFDQFLTPTATIKAKATPLATANRYGCSTEVDAMIPFLKRDIVTLYDLRYGYSYVVKKRTVTDAYITKWIRVGNAGTLLLNIDDLDLNYIMPWEITKIVVNNPANAIKKTPAESIEYEVILPGGVHGRNNLPRNVVIAEPKQSNKLIWIDKDATIAVNYWFEFIDTTDVVGGNDEIVHPDLDDDLNRFEQSPFSFSLSGDEITVGGISSRTVATLTTFTDEDGAAVSSFATKFLVDVPITKCRSVEAFYKWTTQTRRMQLEPSRGFVEEVKPPSFVSIETKVNTPPCGDHELVGLSDTGPMWYPFSSCTTLNFYDVITTTSYCTLPHENTPRFDYRGCAADLNFAYVAGDAGISSCVLKFFFHFANTTSPKPVFSGYANIVPYVNAEFYLNNGWTLPPFGNISREIVERFLSTDYLSYQSKIGSTPVIGRGWMPMVPDKDCFEITFNSLDISSDGGVYSHSDPIYVSQMNFLLAGFIGEAIDDGRYRFEELLEIRIERRVAYPPPMYEDARGVFYSMYNFLDDNTAWVWREIWKPIERKAHSTNTRLQFVELTTPEYQYDMYKDEHRLVSDEGQYNLKFTVPKFDEDGNLATYPSIRLGSGPPRYFEIIYDNYDSSLVEWRDENHGIIDGSGDSGEDDELPYDLTSDTNVWIQDDNILLDAGYLTDEGDAEEAGHSIKLSYDWVEKEFSIKYYNRGIIAEISKNRLKYMPTQTTSESATLVDDVPAALTKVNPCGLEETNGMWFLDTETTITYEFDKLVCPSSLQLSGYIGVGSCIPVGATRPTNYELNKPGLTITTEHGQIGYTLPELASSYLVKSKQEDFYTINLKFDLDPKAMTTERTDWISIKITNSAGVYSRVVDIRFEKAEYINATETIQVWERKYYKSEAESFGDTNLNGPDRQIAPRNGSESGGLYWPFRIEPGNKVGSVDKLRSVFAGQYYPDRIEVNWGDGFEHEVEYQQELYEDMLNLDELGDVRSYAAYLPPDFRSFLNSIRVSYTPPGLVITSEKLSWKNHYLNLGYLEVGAPWQPKGHLFVWSDTPNWSRCLEFGPSFLIYDTMFVHKHLPGEFTEQTATAFEAFMGGVKNAYTKGKYVVNRFFNSVSIGNDTFIGGGDS